MENKTVRQFKKGSLEMVLLCLIAQGETYGYELLTTLNEKAGSVLGWAREGTVYPILYRLQEQGLLKTRMAPSPANGGMKKYYSLTPQGEEALGQLTSFWEDVSRCVDGFVQEYKEASR